MLLTGRALLVIAFLGVIGISGVFYYRVLPSLAVQNPTLSLDMVPADNSYDEATNTMTVGATEDCLTSETGNSSTHLHAVHVIVQNVEDLVGWQVRLNYLGDEMRPNTVNFLPFIDNNTGQGISFVNLPIDQTSFVHRDIISATSIPPAAPGPQTAAFGSTYIGNQNFAISGDTPAKETPDDTSYSAPNGGVLASFTAQVLAGNVGKPSLLLDVDDGNPNSPGSAVAIFDGTSSQEVLLPVTSLGDGAHGEGATCVMPPPIDVRNHIFTYNPPQPLPADGLNIRFSGAVTPRLIQNASGCNAPTISGDHSAGRVDLSWDSLCVNNSDRVVIEITSWPPAEVSCSNWSTLGLRLFGDCDAP